MALSTKWNMGDNIYSLNRASQTTVTSKPAEQFNDGCCGLFEFKHDGKVNRCIVEYAADHSRKDTLLYNNRLYLGICDPKEVHTDQYSTNRTWILAHFAQNPNL